MTDCFWCNGEINAEGVCEHCGSRLQVLIKDGEPKSSAKRIDLTMHVRKPDAAAANGENGTTS